MGPGPQKGHRCPSEGRAFSWIGAALLLHRHAGVIALVAFLASVFAVKLTLPAYLWGVKTMEDTNIWMVDVLPLQPLPGDCYRA